MAKRRDRIIRQWDRQVQDALLDLDRKNVNVRDTAYRLEGLREYVISEYNAALAYQRFLWWMATTTAFFAGAWLY